MPAAMLAITMLWAPVATAAGRFAVVANDELDADGTIRVFDSDAPWNQVKPPLTVGGDAVVQEKGRRLYVISRGAGTLSVIAKAAWEILHTVDLGTSQPPDDVAVAHRRRLYVSRQGATSLLRVDPRAGVMEEVVDLSPFADDDGIPDLGAMIIAGDRLFVQIRRANQKASGGLQTPAYLAVVDLDTEQLIDADPKSPGLQAIELAGTAPKHRMQIVGDRLLLSATGGFFDAGGIEAIDLTTLISEGILIAEADGETGADLGPFTMTSPTSGFLAYSTDLDLSSHLKRFSFAEGVEEGPELHVSVGFAVPAIGFDVRSGNVFVPESIFGSEGIHVFDAQRGDRLTEAPLPTGGRPTDVLVLRQPPVSSGQ
ncbi:MAG TPA: hypothetical protein VEL28_00390 [Candidatus Binatia bacterium]|nr:hypothetical protein [Candidatus Binatia bacterium]